MNQDTISIVIPFHNAANTIVKTLNALEISSYPILEIVCVDDASTDNGNDLIKQYSFTSKNNIILISRQQDKRGAAAARNWGAKKALGNFILFLDADVVMNKHTIEKLVHCMKVNKCTVVVALFDEFSLQPGILAHFQAYTVSAVYRDLDPLNSPCLGTQCALIAAEQFSKSGGFDESFNGATVEDFAFGYRLREQGAIICIARDSIIIHNHYYDIKAFLRNYFIKSRELTILIIYCPYIKISDTGYHQSSNIFLLITFILSVLSVSLYFLINNPVFLLGSIIFLPLIPLALTNYFSKVKQRLGLYTGLIFTILRIIVVVTGWFGLVIGFIGILKNRGLTIREWFAFFKKRLNEFLILSTKFYKVEKND